MELQLAGKVAFIAGASEGLGFAVARQLAREGAKVAILSRSEEKINQAGEKIRQETGAEVLALAGDVSRPEEIEKALNRTKDTFGSIDVLLCNAGGPPAGTFMDFTDEDFYRAFEMNFMSTVRLIRGVIPDMKEKGTGRIGIITSQSVKEPIPGLLLSNSIRAGVTGLARTLANELAPYGILINCFAPGRINTERVKHLDGFLANKRGITPEEVKNEFARIIPLGRYGEPEEFGRVVAFYLSFANTYVTGQTVLVDGGKVGMLF